MWKNGIASRIMNPAATAANTAGRLLMACDQRAQRGDSSVWVRCPSLMARRSRRRGTQRPTNPSSAGSRVSAARTVKATVIAAATATP